MASANVVSINSRNTVRSMAAFPDGWMSWADQGFASGSSAPIPCRLCWFALWECAIDGERLTAHSCSSESQLTRRLETEEEDRDPDWKCPKRKPLHQLKVQGNWMDYCKAINLLLNVFKPGIVSGTFMFTSMYSFCGHNILKRRDAENPTTCCNLIKWTKWKFLHFALDHPFVKKASSVPMLRNNRTLCMAHSRPVMGYIFC